jgi:methionine-gamma-lyase
MQKYAKETDIVHGIHTSHITTMDLVPPIHMTSTYRFRDADHGAGIFSGTENGYAYTRMGNPTVDLFQEKIALLEGGEAAIAASSGMSAIAAVAMTLAGPGDNFVSCTTVYGGTYALFQHDLAKWNIEARFIPPKACCSVQAIESLTDQNTRFLYIETPANPTMDVIDIELWASVAKTHQIPLVVDNTFASPYLQNPLSLGADIVIHSTTKYLNGHGDIIGGVVVASNDMIDRIRKGYIIHYGPVMSPFNAWLILRGMKTLALRMEKHSDNAMKIAKWLQMHPNVENVFYPGLTSHRGHPLAKRQMKKFGGMIAFEIRGGISAGRQLMNKVKLCILAVSLGDCETLIQHPASMTHSTYTPQERAFAGISDGLIRLSVGIENADDIIADLDQALR